MALFKGRAHKEYEIFVEGMRSEACIQKVEATLMAVKGVTEAVASLEENTVRVTATTRVKPSTLRAMIRAAGYRALP